MAGTVFFCARVEVSRMAELYHIPEKYAENAVPTI
jgi:hypothetical protein